MHLLHYGFFPAVTRAPRVSWTSTTNGALSGFGPEKVYDDEYTDWMITFVSADTTPLNWFQIDMSQEEIGIYKVEIIKRKDRPLRFSVS